MKSRRILGVVVIVAAMILLLPRSPFAYTYYLWDDWGGTWSDADKTDANDEDDLMCWAAAASNVLDWTGWGYPSGVNFPDAGDGDLSDDTDELFKYFQDHWTDQGGQMIYGWDWWFYGKNDSQGAEWAAEGWSQVDVTGGGFYTGKNLMDYLYYDWDDPDAMNAIDYALHRNYGTTISIYKENGGHALTVWGYSRDNSGFYNGIYVTDSDDNVNDLKFYSLVQNSIDSKWYLQSFYGTSNVWYIGNVQALSNNPVPEPATLLLLGMGAAGLAGFRRSWRKA